MQKKKKKKKKKCIEYYHIFLYFGKQSEKLKSDILILLNKYFTDHQFHIILTNNFTIGSLCLITKIDSTKACRVGSRNLYVRAAEHAGLSSRTGQPLLHLNPNLVLETTP